MEAKQQVAKLDYPVSEKLATTSQPRLPQPGVRNLLITSALPYVNNTPHLGNLIGCVLSADVFARFARLRGHNTLFICGTDEYGTATELKAAAEGVSCKELCDRYFLKHQRIYQWFGICFDHFGRTTNPYHEGITHEIFRNLAQNGCIQERDTVLPSCARCQRNLSDRLVHGTCPHCASPSAKGDQCDACGAQLETSELVEARCALCGQSDIQLKTSEKHLFLDLPKLANRHAEWYAGVQSQWAEIAQTTTQLAVEEHKKKPKAICISRDLRWGTRIPRDGYEARVFHCWFDAPIGYMSITADYLHACGADPDRWRAWWLHDDRRLEKKQDALPSTSSTSSTSSTLELNKLDDVDDARVELWQFMGKDNITFHSINFPSTLLGAATSTTTKFNLVHQICSTHHLKYEGVKFSKSDEVGVFCDQVEATGINADVWRFYLLALRPENGDTGFYWQELQSKNNFLREKLGSLVTRVLSIVHKKCGGVVPVLLSTASTSQVDVDKKLLASVNQCTNNYVAHFEKAQIAAALEDAKQLVELGHEYLSRVQPYAGSTPSYRVATCLNLSLQLLRQIAVLFQPFIPASSKAIWKMLGLDSALLDTAILTSPTFELLMPAGHRVEKPSWVFPVLITDDDVTRHRDAFGKKASS